MPTPAWILKLAGALFPQRFRLARLTRLPLVGELAAKLLFSGDRVIYLPQDRTIQVNTPVTYENIVLPSAVVEYFTQQASHHFIMDACLCRSSNDCQDYPHSLGCLFLGEAVLKINPKIGRLVSKSEALAHARRAHQSRLVHTIGRSRIDSLLLGAGPSHKLLSICHCCPCCCLWNALPEFSSNIANTISRMPGVQVRVNGNCVDCGACLENVCFMKAIRLEDGKIVISAACRGCGRCAEVCPQGAIEVHIEDNGFVSETIEQIANLVDIR
jgi:ferredoxin